jgi:acetyl esterase/lipase/pimeloyl-ACP methyl ester carboxylesterase
MCIAPPPTVWPTIVGLESIDAWLGDKPWDLIHFNWGLHDLKYMGPQGENLADPANPQSHQQVPPAEYEANLRKLVERLKKTDAKLIWRNTTPIPEGSAGRVVSDAEKYNAIAAKIMQENNIPIHDLYSFVSGQQDQIMLKANVHFSPEGYAQLARDVAKVISAALRAGAQPSTTKTKQAAMKAAGYDPEVPAPTHSSVPYGPHERHVLDFWQAPSSTPTPLVYVIHGGGWQAGEKERVQRFVDVPKLLAAGISVAAINYRFVKQAQAEGIEPPVKAPLYDAARGLQFIRNQADKWNIDSQRIGAAGGSAGACSSLWLAFHDDLAQPTSDDPVTRQSTRLWCAAVTGAQTTLDPQQMKDWTPNSRYGSHAFGLTGFADFLGQREALLPWIAEYSPYALVSRDDPPVYLFYSAPPALGQDQKDPTHTSNFGVKLQEHCAAHGIACELVYPDATNIEHATPTDYLIETLKKSSAYLQPPHVATPYYRVRYPASTVPGELVYAVAYTAWIPTTDQPLRGVIVHQHGCGEGSCKSGQTGAFDLHWQALARKHQCALVSPAYEQPEGANCQLWCDPRHGSDARFQQALADLGQRSGHPELAHVPWALWGHSGGGHWAGGMLLLHPERVAAAWLRSGVPVFEATAGRDIAPHQFSPAAAHVPVMCNLGTKEGFSISDGKFGGVWPSNQAFIAQFRKAGGLVGLAVDPLTSHECGNQRYLAIPWFDACLTARLPATPQEPLRTFDPQQTWVAPLPIPNAPILAPLPAVDYQGDPTTTMWLPNESIAKAWLQYVHDTKIEDTTPPPAPTDVQLVGRELTWQAEADLESGLSHFIIEHEGQEIAQVAGPQPRFGRSLFQGLQYSDTPAAPLVRMQHQFDIPPAIDVKQLRIRAVNTVGLKSN